MSPDAVPIVCADCGVEFEFSVEEQQRFRARGYAPPKRCRPCRDAKRGRYKDDVEPKHGAGPGGAPRETKPMHPTACTICGEPTEVPFVPDGVRPVYCMPCLKLRTR